MQMLGAPRVCLAHLFWGCINMGTVQSNIRLFTNDALFLIAYGDNEDGANRHLINEMCQLQFVNFEVQTF